ncbi:MAG TPA: alpha/beta hydrolase [Baekduia sp.]|nr:alpha/beta hydrolase [Baekduia sp.]
MRSETQDARWWGRPLAETRWALEASRLLVDPVIVGQGVPRGDGRAVVLIPGFLAGDQTLLMLAGWLRSIGYRPQLCGFAFNVDCADRALERVERTVVRLHARQDRRVAVIGHSRGGHLARAVAARRPELVSHAISLGADLQDLYGISAPTKGAVGAARKALQASRRSPSPSCFRRGCSCGFMQAYRRPFPEAVRLTSIYSRGDGVVRWECSVVPEADCIEVTGSHIGLISNRKSYRAIARALASPEAGA